MGMGKVFLRHLSWCLDTGHCTLDTRITGEGGLCCAMYCLTVHHRTENIEPLSGLLHLRQTDCTEENVAVGDRVYGS